MLKKMEFAKLAGWKLLPILAIAVSLVPVAVRGWERTPEEELEEVAEFKPIAEEIVTEPFMKQDQYLLRWLKAYSYDFEKTAEALTTTMEWREQNDLENIIYEYFSDSVKKEYPYVLDGTLDKMGRPILQVLVGHFNLRKTTIAAQEHVLIRYITLMLEMVERYIYYSRVIEKRGNLTQATAIVDLQGYNMMSTGCLKCLSVVPDMVPILESYYPGIFHRIYFINTPRIFETMLTIIKNLMRADTKESLVLYDSEKPIWSAALLEAIPADQLPRKYGGNLQHPNPSLQVKLASYIEMERLGKMQPVVDNVTHHHEDEKSSLTGSTQEEDLQHPTRDHREDHAHHLEGSVSVRRDGEADEIHKLPDIDFLESVTGKDGNHVPHHHYTDTEQTHTSKSPYHIRNNLLETVIDSEKGTRDTFRNDTEPLVVTEKAPHEQNPTNKYNIDRRQFNWTKPTYKDVRKKPTVLRHTSGVKSNFSHPFPTALMGLGAFVSRMMCC